VIASLWQDRALPVPDKRTRIVWLCVRGGLPAYDHIAYIAFTPVKSLVVAGVQGRYFRR